MVLKENTIIGAFCLDTSFSIWILKPPKESGLFIFGKVIFWIFAILKRNRLFLEKGVILESGTLLANI
jgi:hypothetical protein